ncbi:DUF4149 domain-containing protein [Stutzerimonas stutzeri]|uniref:DUF4149 domain-containing protein n=1 Tax=Stutzerimonas stutzeri TaxID=316 RepID=A0A2S4AHF9_STUST|nr:DUF4149 domain-containing protein [Stutzerimonas stutzeri]MCQ4265148.1 DUF4149 domain-containing protein [Stutzerimonas stutzeri]POH80911.1 DUF4149 domain-containing protein [Stutzerimonas stutzeri]
MSKSAISDRQPARAGIITWQLAQTFWVGGLWLLQFLVLPAIGRIGLAPLLVEEIAGNLRPLLVGFAALCGALQVLVLIQVTGLRGLWRDVRGQLLLTVILLAGSQLMMRAGWFESLYWASFSFLVMALCGLMLVLQPAPGSER